MDGDDISVEERQLCMSIMARMQVRDIMVRNNTPIDETRHREAAVADLHMATFHDAEQLRRRDPSPIQLQPGDRVMITSLGSENESPGVEIKYKLITSSKHFATGHIPYIITASEFAPYGTLAYFRTGADRKPSTWFPPGERAEQHRRRFKERVVCQH